MDEQAAVMCHRIGQATAVDSRSYSGLGAAVVQADVESTDPGHQHSVA